MAAINLTPGHKYTLCTGNTVYAAPGTWDSGSHSRWRGTGVTMRTSVLWRLRRDCHSPTHASMR